MSRGTHIRLGCGRARFEAAETTPDHCIYPHRSHGGQTGKAISLQPYISAGGSAAIQLGGGM